MRNIRTVAINLLAIAGLLLSILDKQPIALAFVVASTGLILWAYGPRLLSPSISLLGTFGAARLLLAATGGIIAIQSTHGFYVWLALSTVVLSLAPLVFAARIRRRLNEAARSVRGISVIGDTGSFQTRSGLLTLGNILVTTLLTFTIVIPWLPLVSLTIASILFAATVTLLLRSTYMSKHIDERIRVGLELLAPRFAVYLSGPAGTAYQLSGWIEYFEKLGKPWVIISREQRHFETISEMTSAPLVTASTLRQLDKFLIPSLTTVFYVNNGAKNSHCVRYGQFTHVQLLHGDSDKPSSYSPVTQLFDKVFVAGQAGIDRYHKHGVDIPRHKFEIVGRPQVAGIHQFSGKLADPPTVLYAPTWSGFQEGVNYGSLPIAVRIFRALMRNGARIIFRPHPYSLQDPQSIQTIALLERELAENSSKDHIFGPQARDVDIVDLFNNSDALISDVSAVPADFLFSGKPFAVCKMDDRPNEAFLNEFPLAQASYLLESSQSEEEFTKIISDMLGADPLVEVRQQMRVYYLGDFPAEDYAEIFIRAAQRVINTPKEIPAAAAKAAAFGSNNNTSTGLVARHGAFANDDASSAETPSVDE